jgi:hypothetical protein
MATELPGPSQAGPSQAMAPPLAESTARVLSVAQILNALGIDYGSDAHGTAVEKPEPYLVIPGHDGPRWLIPARSSAAASVLRAWHPYNLSSRMKWFAICTAARAGLLRLTGSVASVAVSRRGALRWFERCGIRSRTGEMVILVGNPSPDRKLVVFLLHDTHSGDTHSGGAHPIAAVLKAGLTDGGGQSVLYEAEVLRKLEPYSWAPRLLSVHPELRAAAQKFVPGAMPDRRFRPEYMEMLCHLPRSGAGKNLAQVAGEMARRLSPFKARLDALAPGLLDRSFDALDHDAFVPTILVHGDFAPWNMRHNAQLGYVLVDWEWADFVGLPAYDLLHFQFNDDRLFGEKSGGYAAIRSRPICAEYLRRMDLDPELLPRLAIAYLLDQLESHCRQRGSQLTAYTLRQLEAVAG